MQRVRDATCPAFVTYASPDACLRLQQNKLSRAVVRVGDSAQSSCKRRRDKGKAPMDAEVARLVEAQLWQTRNGDSDDETDTDDDYLPV